MIKLEEIETAVSHLPKSQLARFREWFQTFDNHLWDQKIERDAKNGKLDRFAQEAIKDFQNKRCKEL